jgi:hypothetical protein
MAANRANDSAREIVFTEIILFVVVRFPAVLFVAEFTTAALFLAVILSASLTALRSAIREAEPRKTPG